MNHHENGRQCSLSVNTLENKTKKAKKLISKQPSIRIQQKIATSSPNRINTTQRRGSTASVEARGNFTLSDDILTIKETSQKVSTIIRRLKLFYINEFFLLTLLCRRSYGLPNGKQSYSLIDSSNAKDIVRLPIKMRIKLVHTLPQ